MAHMFPQLDEMISCLKPCGLLKGVRHILDFESEEWITRDDVNNGLSVLEKHGLTYDLLVRYAFTVSQRDPARIGVL